nr:Ribonuclease VapC2 [Streptococcus thermophilus]
MNGWLIDKSAYVRFSSDRLQQGELWARRIERGLVRVSTVTLLEIGFSARSGSEHREDLSLPPLSYMPVEYVTPAAERRALEVQLLLADRGHHRAPSIPDLLIAAIAETTGLTVLAVDKDFDLIAEITGQPVHQLELNA